MGVILGENIWESTVRYQKLRVEMSQSFMFSVSSGNENY
jgi:hypothetical protein